MFASGTLARTLLVLGLGATLDQAAAAADFAGAWTDNIGGSGRLGTLTIAPGSVRMKRVGYRVAPGIPFAEGELFKVERGGAGPDPLGCGPTGRVGYIVITPLPAIEGTSRRSIQVLFYAGTTAPDVAKLADDPRVCSIHPFGRGG